MCFESSITWSTRTTRWLLHDRHDSLSLSLSLSLLLTTNAYLYKATSVWSRELWSILPCIKYPPFGKHWPLLPCIKLSISFWGTVVNTVLYKATSVVGTVANTVLSIAISVWERCSMPYKAIYV